MMAEQKHPRRKSIKLPTYDYSQPGAYFVTINCSKKKTLFGKLDREQVRLNQFGDMAQEYWKAIPDHFPFVALDAFIIMPNHVHGILLINEAAITSKDVPVRAQHAAPPQKDMHKVSPGSLAAIIRSYKSAVTRSTNRLRVSPGTAVWQRNYFERVIRDESELDAVRHYVTYNAIKNPVPAPWSST